MCYAHYVIRKKNKPSSLASGSNAVKDVTSSSGDVTKAAVVKSTSDVIDAPCDEQKEDVAEQNLIQRLVV